MQSTYDRQQGTYTAHIEGMNYHLYKNRNPDAKGRLLMLHGIRLGGIETWESIIRQLNQWSEILVPDLPGVGLLNPMNQTDHDFSLDDLVRSISQLIKQHDWDQFDMVGYSFGGFLSMFLAQHLNNKIVHHCVIESALLVDAIESLPSAVNNLNHIAALMQSNPEQGNECFSELVSNNNARKFAITSNRRPIHNPLGFANLIRIIASAFSEPVAYIWSTINEQKNMTMILSTPLSTKKTKMLASIGKEQDWNILFMDKTDHSIVFTDADRVACLLNQWGAELF